LRTKITRRPSSSDYSDRIRIEIEGVPDYTNHKYFSEKEARELLKELGLQDLTQLTGVEVSALYKNKRLEGIGPVK
jgi:hypothetical protein